MAAMPAELPASFHPVCQSACKVRGVAGRFRERMILLVKKTVDRNTVSKFAAVCCPGFLFSEEHGCRAALRSWFSGEEFKRTKERKSTQRATTRATLLSLHELSKRCYTQLCSHGCGAWTWATRTLVSASIADYYRAESPNMWVCMRRAAGEERLGVLGARGAERGAGCAARDLRPSCGSVARSGGLRSHP